MPLNLTMGHLVEDVVELTREKAVSELVVSLGKVFQITGVCDQGGSTLSREH